MTALAVRPLTRVAFAPYGEVIETEGARHFPINNGTTERFHDLAHVDIAAGGVPLISIFRAQPVTLPHTLTLLERHPFGSQAFVPQGGERFLVVVAPPASDGAGAPPADPVAFLANGRQGVNYARGVRHHPLLALDGVTDFLVVDRSDDGGNLEEHPLGVGAWTIERL